MTINFTAKYALKKARIANLALPTSGLISHNTSNLHLTTNISSADVEGVSSFDSSELKYYLETERLHII